MIYNSAGMFYCDFSRVYNPYRLFLCYVVDDIVNKFLLRKESIYVQKFTNLALKYPLLIRWFFRENADINRLYYGKQYRFVRDAQLYYIWGLSQVLFQKNRKSTPQTRSKHLIVLNRTIYKQLFSHRFCDEQFVKEAIDVVTHELAHCVHTYLCGVSQPSHGYDWYRIADLMGCTDHKRYASRIVKLKY